jgi:hypothetical protein
MSTRDKLQQLLMMITGSKEAEEVLSLVDDLIDEAVEAALKEVGSW